MTQQMTRQQKRAVFYLRARCIGGSDDGVDAQLAQQRAVCTRIAEQHGATVVREYAAIGDARDSLVRSIVSVMLKQAAEAQADYVITAGMDRLCRGPVDADRELFQAIRETGATLLCGDTWDVSAPLGPSDNVLAEAHNAILAGRPA